MTYLKFISNSFQRSMAYKLEYYIGLLNAFLYIFIFTSVWKAVSKASPDSLGSWNEDKLVRYAILSTLIKVSFGRNDYLVSNKIKNGDIVYDFLKPFNFFLMYVSDTLGVSLFQFLARAIPLLIFSYVIFGLSPGVSLETLLLFFPVYIMAFFIFLLMGFIISCLSFYFTEVFSFMILYSALVTLLSGAVIPVDFFPEKFLFLVAYTPFPYLFYYPAALLVGAEIHSDYLNLILRYLGQVSVFSLIAYFLFKAGTKRLESAGG